MDAVEPGGFWVEVDYEFDRLLVNYYPGINYDLRYYEFLLIVEGSDEVEFEDVVVFVEVVY